VPASLSLVIAYRKVPSAQWRGRLALVAVVAQALGVSLADLLPMPLPDVTEGR